VSQPGLEGCDMKRKLLALAGGLCLATAFGAEAAPAASYAIYAEFARDANKLMQPGLNRRRFNVVEAQSGSDIHLNRDGCIRLTRGKYRITGFSMVTMQTGFAPPIPQNDNNYPGYALVYPKELEQTGLEVLEHAVVIGTPGTAQDTAPSHFDAIYTATKPTTICVGHQSGEDLHGEVYLSVYEVDGIPSEYHVFARIAITKM
jgi:hypothetical protein